MLRALLLTLLLVAATSAKMRTWTDSTGKFTVQAEFVETKDDNVTLKTNAGKTKTVPIARLSPKDQAYIRRLLDSLKDGSNKQSTALAEGSGAVGIESKLADASDNEPVYVSPTGNYYHKKSCSNAGTQSVQMTLSQALDEKYKPCPVCHSESKSKVAKKEDKLKGEPRPRRSYNRQPAQSGFLDGGGGVGNGGSVHVRGYTRRDGTYVQPYTRRAPSR